MAALLRPRGLWWSYQLSLTTFRSLHLGHSRNTTGVVKQPGWVTKSVSRAAATTGHDSGSGQNPVEWLEISETPPSGENVISPADKTGSPAAQAARSERRGATQETVAINDKRGDSFVIATRRRICPAETLRSVQSAAGEELKGVRYPTTSPMVFPPGTILIFMRNAKFHHVVVGGLVMPPKITVAQQGQTRLTGQQRGTCPQQLPDTVLVERLLRRETPAHSILVWRRLSQRRVLRCRFPEHIGVSEQETVGPPTGLAESNE